MGRTLIMLACAAVLASSQAPPATGRASGTIRGRVELEQPPSGTHGRPGVAGLGMMETHGVTADQRRSVVYLESAPRGAFEDRGDLRARMDQRNETFVPHVLAVLAGTSVEFTNSDRTYHNVFSLSRIRPFDLGRYPTGKSKSVRFDRPGIVRVFCDIHSHMSAFILVFAHPFFDVADADGRFRIDNVPPGTYVMAVWHETRPRDATYRVTVPEQGGDVELNVLLGRAGQ
jgi:plastocyanin